MQFNNLLNKDVEKWAKQNNCEIDEHNRLHVYKAVHKVVSNACVRYISDFGVHYSPYNSMVIPEVTNRFEAVVEYEIGVPITVPDDKFNCSRFITCAPGLHAAGFNFARRFGDAWGDGCILELVIDLTDYETDVVIPYDEYAMRGLIDTEDGFDPNTCKIFSPKIRANKMTPIREVGELSQKALIYTNVTYDWSFVLAVLNIKKEIRTLEKDQLYGFKNIDRDKVLARLNELTNALGTLSRVDLRNCCFK